MKKIHFILLLNLLSINCFSQEDKAIHFDTYRTICTDYIIDLTQQDHVIRDKQVDYVILALAKKDEEHLGYFRFTLDKEINLADTSTIKTVLFTTFVSNLQQEIKKKNSVLKKQKIRKAVSFDNLLYAPVLIQLKSNDTIKYYRSQIKYQEIVF
ncbi:hypothetical protein M2306_001615 [Myroides gitamensis]|uniref:Uncharacterized protein n=1 Tax=Myroides odoratus TaxID=256 RepID=A0A378RKG3_MYROD|nr:hypothetical protein [Myroides odoratus]MCS4238277.1 hypothetical protein [Myroides odoratus]MDH6600921.1 hypothetical protein [Myroides gitamensis]QQU02234.1 hypothetical protein I6I89_10165 [Myroides odoratus]STZ26849.1 Uncharacterised protein [Myroides odoratus]